MRNAALRVWTSVLAFIVTVAVNGLANALPLNGQSTGEISDRFPVYFFPAGYVFSIWGLIYLGLVGHVIFQVLSAQRQNPRLRSAGYPFVLSCLANATWLFLWHYELFVLSLAAMVTLLLLLIVIYLRLEIGRLEVTRAERWLAQLPFSIYLGWITVATIANASSVFYHLNWSGWGISPEAWTVIMLVAATGIASAVSLSRGDVAYMLVIIWALAGIAIKQASTTVVAMTAWAMAAVVALVLVAGSRRRHLLQNPRSAARVA
jgi:benzodiazapine receptor